MKVNVSTTIPFFQKSGTKSKDAENLFRGPPPEATRVITQGFRGTVPAGRILSRSPSEVAEVRNRQGGLVNLKSFRTVYSQPPQGAQPQGVQAQGVQAQGVQAQGALHVGQQVQLAPQLPQPQVPQPQVPQPQVQQPPPTIGERAQALLLKFDAVGAEVSNVLAQPAHRETLSEAAARLVRGGPSNQPTVQDLAARDKATQSVTELNRSLRALEAECVPGDEAVGRQIREKIADTTLLSAKLTLPELAPILKRPEAAELADSLMRLDTALQKAAGGDKTYNIGKAIDLLANYGRIREFASSPDPGQRAFAIESLRAMTDAVGQAATPPRDGSALNGLIGRDADFDKLIRQIKLTATTDLIMQGQPAPSQQEATTLATKTVDAEMNLQRMKNRLGRAMTDAGSKVTDKITMTGLGGIKVDAALIKGLREKLGGNAKDVGLVVAGLLVAEREVASSAGARQLRGGIQARVAELRTQKEELTGPDTRATKLGAKLDQVRARLDEATKSIDERLAKGPGYEPSQALLSRRDGLAQQNDILAAAYRDAMEPVRKVDEDIRFLEQRGTALTTEGDLCAAKLVEAQGNVVSFKNRIDDLEVEILEKEIAALELQVAQDQREAPRVDDGVGVGAMPLSRQEIEQTRRETGAAVGKLGAEVESLKTDMQGLESRLGMATKVADYWSVRARAVEVPKELTDARGALDRATGAEAGSRDRALGELQLLESHMITTGDVAGRDVAPGDKATLTGLRSAALTGGITASELTAMGLSDAESREALAAAGKLAKKGLRSADQVQEITRDINKIMDKFNQTRVFANTAISGQRAAMVGGKNEEQVKVLAERIVANLTMGNAGDTPAAKMTDALRGVGAKLTAGNPAESDLRAAGQAYGRAETRLFRLTTSLNELDEQRDRMRDLIRNVDPNRNLQAPPGLAVSKALAEAHMLVQSRGTDVGRWPPADRARFGELQQALRGLNTNNLSVPTIQAFRAPPSADEILRFPETRPNLLPAAFATIQLRETQIAARQDVHTQIAETAREMRQIVDSRRTAMGEDGIRLRDAIRAAILQTATEAAAGPGKVPPDKFVPAEHAAAIKTKLEGWGVDLVACSPEINNVLQRTFGVPELNSWAATSDFRNLDQVQAVKEKELERTAEKGRTGISSHVKAELLDGIDRMRNGTKLKLVAGDRVEVQTGNIPLDPWMIGQLNVKAAVGKLDGIEIERGSDGYQLVLRDGWDAKGGGEVSADLTGAASPLLKPLGLKLQATAGLEASGYKVTGAVLRFPDTPEGRKDMKATVEALLTKGKVTAREIMGAEDIMPLVETRIGGKASVGAKFGWDPLNAEDFLGKDAQGGSGPRARVKAGFSGGMNVVNYDAHSTNRVVLKDERTYEVDLTGSAAINVKLSLKNTESPVESASTDALAIGVKANLYHLKVKWKHMFNEGQVQAGTEYVRQSFTPVLFKESAVYDRLGGGQLRQICEKPGGEKLKEQVDTLIKLAGPEDIISVGYKLDPTVLAEANRHLRAADDLRSGKTVTTNKETADRQAHEHRERARDLIENSDNYFLSKVQLIPTIETMKAIQLNAIFVNWTAYTEDKSEWVAAEIPIDPKAAQEVARGV